MNVLRSPTQRDQVSASKVPDADWCLASGSQRWPEREEESFLPLLAELIAAEPLACILEAQTEKRPWQLPRKPREPEIAKTCPAFFVAVLSNVVRESCAIRMWKLCVYIDLFTKRATANVCGGNNFNYFREEDRCNFRENAILVQIRLQTSSSFYLRNAMTK